MKKIKVNNNFSSDLAIGLVPHPNSSHNFTTTSRKDKSRAIFQQIKDFVVERIESGVWTPEAPIPSENEFVRDFGVSRGTVHRALRELTFEGYLSRIQGVGTFVASRKYYSDFLEIKPISKEIVERGGEYTCDVHLVTKLMAKPDLASLLVVPQGSIVYHSLIVHRENGLAIQLEERYVNPAFAPEYLEQDFTIITPSTYLFRIAPPTEAEQFIGAVLPDKEALTLLEIAPPEPCLVMHRRTWVGNIVATKAKLLYPGSRFILGGRFKPQPSSF